MPADSEKVLLALVGPIFSAIIAYLIARTQLGRTRKYAENAATAALLAVAFEAFSITTDRLSIRFSRALLPSEGPELRQLRSNAAVAALAELKAADLPAEMVGPFIRFRSGISALNAAMNAEPTDKDIHLGKYKNLYEWMRGDYEVLRSLSKKRIKQDPGTKGWMPPSEYEVLNWAKRNSEKS